MFQSTHPHGVRLFYLCDKVLDISSFNPRTHMGCDQVTNMTTGQSGVSIHAPTWGATTKVL